MEEIFIESLFNTSIQCKSKHLSKDIDAFLLNSIKEMYEGKCNKDGFVMIDSISIIKRSIPYLYGSQLNGNIKFNIIYKANICNPVNGNIIKCNIHKINKLGLLSIKEPLTIIIAKEFHNNKNIFNKLKENDLIEIVIIDKKFNINDTKIQIIAKLNNDTDAVVTKYKKENDNVMSDNPTSDLSDSDNNYKSDSDNSLSDSGDESSPESIKEPDGELEEDTDGVSNEELGEDSETDSLYDTDTEKESTDSDIESNL
jgi:DNA-directed RNA polymerase subunit E'/Rpb7